MINRYFILSTFMAAAFMAAAQGVHYEQGLSIRNKQQGHYFKMVSWDDSQYKEFAYWEETQFGSVLNFMNWRAIFPPGFDKSDTITKYPAIVMVHGAGESGRKWTNHYEYSPSDPEYDNNGHQLLHGGREHRDAVNRQPSHSRAFPGIVIFPQASYNAAWVSPANQEMIALIIEYMIEEYNINRFKISLHGLSNGGKGSWDIATFRPDLFAGVLPMSGVGANMQASTDALVTTPLWLFQGGQDSNPSPGWAEQWIEELEEKGGKPRYTLYPNLGHGTWNTAYAEPDFFSWMLARDKRNIYVFGDTTDLTVSSQKPMKLGFSAGYLAYQWTRNGVNIPNANSRFLDVTTPGIYRVKFQQRIDGTWAESFPLELEPFDGSEPIVFIPDNNFKNALVANSAINTNQDGEIQVAEAEAFTGTMNVNSSGISNLTGIEAFTALTDLRVLGNSLTSLDLQANTALAHLHCQSNQLDSLNLSANSSLNTLRCFDNNLASLIIQNGNNENITLFQAYNNNLTCIQVDNVAFAEANWTGGVDSGVAFSTDCSGGVQEEIVNIPDPNLKTYLLGRFDSNSDGEIQESEAEAADAQEVNVSGLGISDMTGIHAFALTLEVLDCSNNNLTFLDATGFSVVSIECENNAIEDILIDDNVIVLDISGNNLTSLTLPSSIHEFYLDVSNNELTSLDISARQGEIFDFNAMGNPGLECVQVSDPATAESQWSDNVDEGVVFSTNCSAVGGPDVVHIPDSNLKNALLANLNINTNGDSEIQVTEAEAYTGMINVNSRGISNMTGIEAFTALTDLRVHNNSISVLNLSSNTALVQLHCQKNNLTTLDISGNPSITKLRCFNNALTFLNVQNGNNSNFDLFEAYDNDLTCIQVDNVSFAQANWSDDVDSGVAFSTACSGAGARVASESQVFHQGSPALSVYPNPFSNELNIKLTEDAPALGIPVKVYDMKSGSALRPDNVLRDGGEIRLDLSGLTPGHYLLQVGESTYRVVKDQ